MLVSAVEEIHVSASPLAEKVASFTSGAERKRAGLNGDPFVRRFFARVPTDIAQSFTPVQLDAIKMVFGASL
jgi:hypothetical protein